MASLRNTLIASGTRRVPGLRRLPVLKLLALAEIALLARDHLSRLESADRRRLFDLVRLGGRTRTLSSSDREELIRILAKTDPRRFAGLAADRLSPVPLPRRVVYGPRRSRRS